MSTALKDVAGALAPSGARIYPPPADPSTSSSTSDAPTSIPSTSSTPSTSSAPTTDSSTSTPEPTPTPSESSTTPPPSTTSAPETTVGSSTSSGSQGTTVIYVTSTQTPPTNTDTSSLPSSSATDSAELATATAAASGGLSASSTIAVAVVVPVVSVALIILALLFFWRKRKAKKAAEEERRKEVEEYGFNPNNDPTLPGMAGIVAPKDDSAGYRGWGTTSAGRKASTNLSSGFGGVAMSEGSGPGYHHAATASEGTVQYSDGVRPDSGEIVEPIGVLGAAPVAANNRNGDIHRGPSNASSAYSAANRSEASEESHMSAHHPSGGYYGENPYYADMGPHGAYGGDEYQPVIRDVQARRNTRIENPGVYPRQGNAGIAQNF
ncbi:hypothetical protein N7535_004437 [Penicillium sp. DV-2018c]|nr:hypothetical protein N7535_004437 [Penicillium sp. DV-2018c]